MANPCPAGAAWKDGPGWASWGAGLANTRFQTARAAGLRAADLPRLTLKWAFAFPDSAVLRSQPAVYRGRVFATMDSMVWSTMMLSMLAAGVASQYYDPRTVAAWAGVISSTTAIFWAWANWTGRLPEPEVVEEVHV